MRDAARALTCIITALTVASCIHGEPVDLDRWNPPPKEVVDNDEGTVVAGRLWVVPNPIRLRPEWGGDPEHPASVGFQTENIGSTEATITHMRISGNPDFFFGRFPGDDPELPKHIGGNLECGSGAGRGDSITWNPSGDSLAEATLTIETDDATSPTLVVPIVFDTSGTHTPESYLEHASNIDTYVDIRPNPVHIAKGVPTTLDLCIGVQNAYESFALDAVTIHGEGLSLVEPVDLSAPGGFSIEYTPVTDDDVNGALIVDFTDNWGDEETLVVPILVR